MIVLDADHLLYFTNFTVNCHGQSEFRDLRARVLCFTLSCSPFMILIDFLYCCHFQYSSFHAWIFTWKFKQLLLEKGPTQSQTGVFTHAALLGVGIADSY